MSKQTAVEWLQDQFRAFGTITDSNDENTHQLIKSAIDMCERAKAMHKEEQRQTFEKAQKCTIKHDGVYFNHTSFDEYYNETYGK